MLLPVQKLILQGIALISSVHARSFGGRRADICCYALRGLYRDDILFQGNPKYEMEVNRYFSASNVVRPACIFVPNTAEKVSHGVKIFKQAKCPFAVKSGGHSPNPGSNGRDGAVLVVTTGLNKVSVDQRSSIARIGPGLDWAGVYRITERYDSVVLGGRVGSVGVGGLLLGGGISHQGSEHGFACDTIVNFEIVTGDGNLRNANATSNPDLFWALKGGGNRFGIVTRFDMKTYPLSLIYGGTITYGMESLNDVLDAIDTFHRQERDPKASMFLNIIDATDLFAGVNLQLVLYYGRPVTAPPPVFQPFFEIQGIRMKDVQKRPFSELVSDDTNGLPTVMRHSWRTLTYKRSDVLNRRFVDIWLEENERYRASRSLSQLQPGVYVLAFEPLATRMLLASGSGANALGLNPRDGPQMIVLVTYTWGDPTEDESKRLSLRRSVDGMKVLAQKSGKYSDFVYINTAAPDQLPYQSYGERNYRRLGCVREVYDPGNVFSELQSSGYPL